MDSCHQLETAVNLRRVGKDPKGFKPCSICLPQKLQLQHLNNRKRYRSKLDIMQEQLIRVGERYGMHINIKGGVAYVTTICGEWFFSINDRPIRIHHKNIEKYGEGHYHVQDMTFPSPSHALVYIRHHEQAAIKRLFEEFDGYSCC